MPEKRKRAPRRAITSHIEIVRSFSLKRNLENHLGPAYRYEVADYFCSAKKHCPIEKAEETGEILYEYCKKEVLKSIRAFEAELRQMGPALEAQPGKVINGTN